MKKLLLFVPVAIVANLILPNNPAVVFIVAVVAIIPLSSVLGEATEHLAFHTGDAVGGLLNATFGNLPELLILTSVLMSGLIDVVLAGLYGAIIVNAILATGVAMFFGGLKHHTQNFQSEKTAEFSSLLAIAVFALAIISMTSKAPGGPDPSHDKLNVILSSLLIVGYGMFLWYSLVTHKDLHAHTHHTKETVWSFRKSLIWLVITSAAVVWISEILAGTLEIAMKDFNLNQKFMGAIMIAVITGAAQMASAVRVARVNRMDLALTISMGASVQIALFIAPLLVIISYAFMAMPMHLHFNSSEVLLLFMAVYIVSTISRGGKSTWYGGALLTLLYIILGTCYYF